MAKKITTPQTTPQSAYLMRLDEAPKALAMQILNDPSAVSLVPTDQLVPLFVQGHDISTKVGKVLEVVKEELKTKRRGEGKPYGNESQHRRLEVGDVSVCIEERKRWPLNTERTITFLKGKGIFQEACNLEVTSGIQAFQSFLWKNRKFLRENGIEVREVLSEEKVEALVGLKKISLKDFETLIDKNDPTYAVKIGK